MHAVILTLLSFAGGEPVTLSDDVVSGDHACVSCGDECGGGCKKLGHAGRRRGMPQTCYNPVYGCYTSSRYMQRYSAFQGTYYRRPYNYRNVFDFPWHAQPHEPTSLFSYNVEREEVIDENLPPVPPRDARRPSPRKARISIADSELLSPATQISTRRVK